MPYTNPVKLKEYKHEWEVAHRPEINARRRVKRRALSSKLKERAGHLKRKFNLTVADYDAMVLDQGGVCAICHKPPCGRGKAGQRLCVDHSHSSGKVRKLLCLSCNMALGLLEDSPDRLRQAAKYLESF